MIIKKNLKKIIKRLNPIPCFQLKKYNDFSLKSDKSRVVEIEIPYKSDKNSNEVPVSCIALVPGFKIDSSLNFIVTNGLNPKSGITSFVESKLFKKYFLNKKSLLNISRIDYVLRTSINKIELEI